MNIVSSSIAVLKGMGMCETFYWYSNVANAVMTKRIIGSFQPLVTNGNVFNRYSYNDGSGNRLMFTDSIEDHTGFRVTPGDYIYKAKTKTVHVGTGASFLNEYIDPDTSNITCVNSNDATSYTYGVDYDLDFQRGKISCILPTSGDPTMTDTFQHPNMNWYDGATFSQAEYNTSNNYLMLDVDPSTSLYYASGYWLSYPVTKHTNLGWNAITVTVSKTSDHTVTLKIFDGSATDAAMIADTSVLQTASLSTGANTVDISALTAADLRFKVTLATAATNSSPYFKMYSTGLLTVTYFGAKCAVTYQYDKYRVERVLDDSDKTGYIEVALARWSGA